MILVLGATGTVGRALVRRLAASRLPFRAIVRDEAKGRALDAPYAVADLDDAASLVRAFAGGAQLFLNSSPGPAMLAQQRRALGAAKAAGIAHVVKLSTRGAALDSAVATARIHAELEAELKAAGMGWTILQPGFFMQNFLRHAEGIKGEGKFFGAFRDGRIAFLDVEDIAKVAAAAMAAVAADAGDARFADRTLVLTGPELLTHAEVAACFSAKLGRAITYVDLPVEKIVGFMIGNGTPPEMAQGLGAMMTAMAAGQAAYRTSTVEEVTGEPAGTFAQFVERNLAAFR